MSEPTVTQYGGFWVRFLALLADSAILFLVCAALLLGAVMVLGPEELTPAIFAVSLLALLYWPVMHASRLQATLGKAVAGLKVVRFNGERISIRRSLWREVGKIFSAAVLMLGYVMAAVTPRKQGLHDLMAGTYVVHEGPSRVVVALAITLGGFALPVFVGPMVADRALISSITGSAEGLVPRQDLVKMISPFDLLKLFSRQDAVEKQAARPAGPALSAEPATKAAPEPTAAPKPKAPASAPVAKAPSKKREAAAPKTDAVAIAPKAVLRPPPPRPPSTSLTGSGARYNDLVTAVMYQDVEGVRELIKLGKWVDKPDSRGVTPIVIAAERGDLRVAEALLRGGANPRPAVRVAEQRQDGEMVQLLKRYAR